MVRLAPTTGALDAFMLEIPGPSYVKPMLAVFQRLMIVRDSADEALA